MRTLTNTLTTPSELTLPSDRHQDESQGELGAETQLGDEDGANETDGDTAEVLVPKEAKAFFGVRKTRHESHPER